MKHVKAFSIKFVATFVLLFLVLGGVQGITFGDIFSMSLVLGGAAYLLGDLFLLPRTSNTIASLADLGLAFILIYFMSGGMTDGGPYRLDRFLPHLLLWCLNCFIISMSFRTFCRTGEKQGGPQKSPIPDRSFRTDPSRIPNQTYG